MEDSLTRDSSVEAELIVVGGHDRALEQRRTGVDPLPLMSMVRTGPRSETDP